LCFPLWPLFEERNRCSSVVTGKERLTHCKENESNLRDSYCNFLYGLNLLPTQIRRTDVAQYSDCLRAGWSWFDFRQRKGFFLFTTTSKLALGSNHSPVQWVQEIFLRRIKRPEREDGKSPPSSAEIKNTRIYISIPPFVFVAWCLIKHTNDFIFT
jgi:hypothetical protein